jgi:hypothetical protein
MSPATFPSSFSLQAVAAGYETGKWGKQKAEEFAVFLFSFLLNNFPVEGF